MLTNAASTSYMIANFDNPNVVIRGNTIDKLIELIELIDLNLNQEFVEKNFDTDIYVKEIYNNPKFIKETKYSIKLSFFILQ